LFDLLLHQSILFTKQLIIYLFTYLSNNSFVYLLHCIYIYLLLIHLLVYYKCISFVCGLFSLNGYEHSKCTLVKTRL